MRVRYSNVLFLTTWLVPALLTVNRCSKKACCGACSTRVGVHKLAAGPWCRWCRSWGIRLAGSKYVAWWRTRGWCPSNPALMPTRSPELSDRISQICWPVSLPGDITYVWADGRWHYLAAVLDLHTQRVMGWSMPDWPDADLAVKALEMAYQQRGSPFGVLFHSDLGSQYGSRVFRQRLWRYRRTQSMNWRGNCWNNAPMERLFRSLKTEWLPATVYMSLRLLQMAASTSTQ